ncbi:hypothetical protein HR060_00115 [Catenovulum sp. SM1970]|uniref:hypothetical protein n=1 Tax=Marinifaba aquimaris TaxID=2741323 RepID=UPI0015733B7A|nr:hypothetical protein [Marinifaba aquimaris]NTS75252.1 hypothetical protein [Marinifaba aquimaris]
MYNWRCLSVLIISFFTLIGCNQTIEVNLKPVPKETVDIVHKNFQQRFLYGEWRYQGTETEPGKVLALIQIPEKLSLSEEQTSAYIQQVICPKRTDTDVWQQLNQVSLAVNLYITTQASGFTSQCPNPLV